MKTVRVHVCTEHLIGTLKNLNTYHQILVSSINIKSGNDEKRHIQRTLPNKNIIHRPRQAHTLLYTV